MDKYKYVDGVKYKVVPNSSLGYNLVPVDEGGGEDGDGGGVFFVDAIFGEGGPVVQTPAADIFEAINAGKYIVAKLSEPEGGGFDYLTPLTSYSLGPLRQLSFEQILYNNYTGAWRVGSSALRYNDEEGWTLFEHYSNLPEAT